MVVRSTGGCAGGSIEPSQVLLDIRFIDSRRCVVLDVQTAIMSITHVFQQVEVDCPFRWAQPYFERSLSGGHSPQIVRLRATLYKSGPLPIALHGDAIVTCVPAPNRLRLYPCWTVRWTPAAGGPYPDFEGTLTLRGGSEPATSRLEISGDYQPPLGAAGRAFDAALGSRIASATARGLLEDFAADAAFIYHRNAVTERERL